MAEKKQYVIIRAVSVNLPNDSNLMTFHTFTLPNGIRLIHQETQSPVAHCAFYINIGSRDETDSEAGMAHFIEHLLFKGTHKRKAFHILSRMEDVGGEINAFTTKEETCIHCSFLKAHCERAIELLSDLMFQSTFSEKALQSEREVILEEINSYKDTPSERIFDDFEDLVFSGHPLGRNILGTRKSLLRLQRKDILRFMEAHYTTNRMVIATAGALPFSRICHWAAKYLGHFPSTTGTSQRLPFSAGSAVQQVISKKTHQTHTILGNTAYSLNNPQRSGLFLLTNLLGGNGMTARLNMILREKRGLAYNVEASYTPFVDTGIFTIYFGTDRSTLDKSLTLTQKELTALCEKPLGTLQLHKAKMQLIGQMAIASESDEARMMSYGKSFLLYDRVEPLEEVFKKIELVSATELREIANEIISPARLFMLTYS